MDQVLVPWFQVLDPHLGAVGYLLGGRPSLADFALFGANVAHFVGDAYCREVADEHGLQVVAHTHRLQLPQRQSFGGWMDPDAVPESLIAVVAQAAHTVAGVDVIADITGGPTPPARWLPATRRSSRSPSRSRRVPPRGRASPAS